MGERGKGSFDLLLSIWAVLREIFPCLVPFLSPARTICGHVRSGFMVPACLGDGVSDCGCTTAGRYSLSGEGVGEDLEFSDSVRNTRRFFFSLLAR